MIGQLEYRGYTGSVEYSDEDKIFFGKVQNISDLVSYEGKTVEMLEKDFQEAIDEYIDFLNYN